MGLDQKSIEMKVKEINKIKSFIRFRESEHNDHKVTKDNAIWLPVIGPVIFLPVAFVIDYISIQNRISSSVFYFSVALAVLTSILNVYWGIKRNNKRIGESKAFFAVRMYMSGFFSLIPICILIFTKFSISSDVLDERKMIGFTLLFAIMMVLTYVFGVCVTVHMISSNSFKVEGVLSNLLSYSFYIPLLIASKIIGKSDNSYLGFVFLCMIMGIMVYKTAYYHLKLKYALKYNLEDLLPNLDNLDEKT